MPASAAPAARALPLRAWQEEALRRYLASGARDFLVTATPGAGKTRFALAAAAALLARREVARVIVVTPTDHLRTQWAEAAEEAGLPLDPSLANSVGPIGADFTGAVVTYAQVAAAPMLHRARCEARRSLVILDELHHAGDAGSWGEALLEAFDPARRRLALTGTPFRSDDAAIPFVRYEQEADGTRRSVADHAYGYRAALADGVVRPVMFAAYSGQARWRDSAGEVVAAGLSEPMTAAREAAAWRTALNPRGRWVPHVIAAMDERIGELRRRGMPDAAGLVLASDQDAARAYAAVVERVTGSAPALILSDDPQASRRISSFRDGDERIAVCVRMISEGVDVPRAACLAWLTAYRTPLFFAQAVGRVVRARRPGETATVFLPAVRPLLSLAAELEAERDHVLAAPSGPLEGLDPLPPPEPAAADGLGFEPLDAQAEFAHLIFDGAAHTGELVGDVDALGLFAHDPGLLTPEQTATLLRGRDERARVAAERLAAAPAPVEEPVSLHRRHAALRREVNALVARLAHRTGRSHAQLHAEARRAVPGPASASAPVEILERRRDWLLGAG